MATLILLIILQLLFFIKTVTQPTEMDETTGNNLTYF
jgi:hypothetical protein